MIHYKIKALREYKKITQDWISYELGISQEAYSKLERGVSKISFIQVEKICEIFNISIEDLLINNYHNKNENIIMSENKILETENGVYYPNILDLCQLIQKINKMSYGDGKDTYFVRNIKHDEDIDFCFATKKNKYKSNGDELLDDEKYSGEIINKQEIYRNYREDVEIISFHYKYTGIVIADLYLNTLEVVTYFTDEENKIITDFLKNL